MRRAVAALAAMSIVISACSADGAGSTAVPPTGAPGTTAATAPVDPPEDTSTTSTTTTTTPPALDAAVARLDGLGFDEFVDESFRVLLERQPQTVVEFGLADRFGMPKAALDDLSDPFLRETREIESAALEMLQTYDRDSLDPAQRVTYDVYEWYLDDLVRGHPFAYHDYPIHHMLGSYHWWVFFYFVESFPLETPGDAGDFVAAVGGVGDQAAQVLEGMRIRESMGVVPPDFIVGMARSAMMGQLGMRTPDVSRVDPTGLDIYRRFAEDSAVIEGLDPDDREGLLAELEEALEGSLIPAWGELIDYLADLERSAKPDAGVWKLPDGEAYYAFLLRRETSTDLTAEEIHEIGLAEVARVRAEMRERFDELGYPPDESFSDSMARVVADGGTIDTRIEGPDAVIEAYYEILGRIEPRIDPVFGLRPQAELQVLPDPSYGGGGGFYSQPSLDGTRPGAFYAGTAPSVVTRFDMATVLHHEGVPGHHFQIALAQELGLPLMRSVYHFNGYVEGWALYAEYLAAELGVYDGDPYGDLGRLHLELLRSVRLVADTGIHAMGWTRQEAQAYMAQAMGGWIHEVDRYVVMPAQATGYKIGMLEILRLRALAEDRLGARFELPEFHDVVIGNGSLPLEVLDRLVEEWISETESAS